MNTSLLDPFGAVTTFTLDNGSKGSFFSLPHLEDSGIGPVSRLPVSLRIVLESLLRNQNGSSITEEDVTSLANWNAQHPVQVEIPFTVTRVVMQDFTGVPAIVDLAAMRAAVERAGKPAGIINPLVPVNMVVDHSVQVDVFGSEEALQFNTRLEFERNNERYKFLKWGKQAFENFDIVPPSIGIVHQVNLEYLARGVFSKELSGGTLYFPDSLVGTDSHTTMINGIGIVGWGVGGIEAEAALLGQPVTFLTPAVVGVHLSGQLREGVTATDLVLTVVEVLRKTGVVGKFVEFFGEGAEALTLPDRATVANMAPEFGATMGFFPVDEETLRYYSLTGRSDEQVDLVRSYFKAQDLFGIPGTGEVDYSQVVEVNLDSIEPSLAGPRLPQERKTLSIMKESFLKSLSLPVEEGGFGRNEGISAEATAVASAEEPEEREEGETDGMEHELRDGDVVLAAITSCTNTSNPIVMLGSGLLARKAVEKGLRVPSYVKTSLAPGSRVVTDYLEKAGLLPYLEKLGFHIVGYGCTTCIGNSGPLPEEIRTPIVEKGLVCASVLSGNRNFEARIHPDVKASYLASPPLVVAYALAGTVLRDLTTEPIGEDEHGEDVFLKDIWPDSQEILDLVESSMGPDVFIEKYADIDAQATEWNELVAQEGMIFEWDSESTYIQEPPYFKGDFDPFSLPAITDIEGARSLLLLGDNITTDHISPAGSFAPDTPAGTFLRQRGIELKDFNSYGSRRGNHQVMIRGTFANNRIRNLMVKGREGGFTRHQPDGTEMTVYEAAMKYQEEGMPLIVMAGINYGSGSSRDWAAKGTKLLGVRAVVARSFERIHRSNLAGMGVLPLQFREGVTFDRLGINGTESFHIRNLEKNLKPSGEVVLEWENADGGVGSAVLDIRLDTPIEVEIYRNGGILDMVLRKLIAEA